MTRYMKTAFRLLDLVVIFVMAFGSPLGALAAPSPTGATIVSDLADYPPGAIVTLTGAGWVDGEPVHIFVNDDAGRTWKHDSSPDPVAGADGAFTYQFQLPSWFIANYTATATGPYSGVATTAFTDMSIGTYDQCSNDKGTGYASGDTGCRWINGNLQGSNSYYAEGDATVQRLWLTDLVPDSTHTITFQYSTTKDGKHTYDFLTSWDWSESWILPDDLCQGITGCTAVGADQFPIPQDPNVPDSYESLKARNFTVAGGDLTSATNPLVVVGSFDPVTGYSNVSETSISITFTVGPSTGPMCETKLGVTTCGVAIWFGAHVASALNWGAGMGASSVSGSPYHVAFAAMDGAAVGQRDNQMQASAVTIIPPGTITIIKDAVPNDAQDFSFNLNNNSTVSQDFKLDDDADPTLPNSQTFSVPPGIWYASELLPLPSGWSLTKLVCVDPTSNTTVDLATGAATINLASSETVTCTYTDTKGGHIIVEKQTTPDGVTQSFEFDPSWSTTNFFLTDGQTSDSGPLSAGNYSVAEVNVPSGWTMTGATCDDGSPITAISLQEGETVKCTFNNSRDTGSLKILKAFNPLTSGFTGKFTVNYDCDGTAYDGSVQLGAGEFTMISGIPTGTSCTVSEPTLPAAPLGWTFGTPSVSPAQPVTINSTTVPVEVTVTNTISRDQGYLKISKAFDPKTSGFSGTFAVVYNCGTGDVTVNLAAGASTTVGPFDTGTSCTVSEPTLPTAPTGWTFGTPSVSGSPATIVKGDQAAAVAVTVTNSINRDLGNLKITKTTNNPDGATLPAAFTGTYDCGAGYTGTFSVADGASQVIGGIPTGNVCSVIETQPAPIPGFTWGTITYTPDSITIDSKGGTFEIVVGNSITRDLGNLKLSKSLVGGPAGYTGPFQINYDCDGTAYDGSKMVTAGSFETVTGIPTGTSCTISETLPTPPAGYAFDIPTFSPSATVTITTKGATVEVTTNNKMTQDLTVTKTAVEAFGRTYSWNISKNVDKSQAFIAAGGTATFTYTVGVTHDNGTDSGFVVSGEITIHNPNIFDVAGVDVTDAAPGGTCTVTNGTDLTVPAGGDKSAMYSCTFASNPGSGKNTATATWDAAEYHTPTGSASGTANFDFAGVSPAITNGSVTVTDTLGGNFGPVYYTDPSPKEFSYEKSFAGIGGTCTNYDNTATINENGKFASQTVEVCVGLNLTVTKTAAGTFDRTYLWKISKAADKPSVNIAEGGFYTFHYTVDVEQTGITDAGWTLAGKITIANPNDWQDITLTSLSDAVDNGGVCTVAAGPYVVPKSGSLDVAYTCSFASAPTSYSGTNTATATWDKAAAFTPGDTASGSAPFTLGQLGSTNKTVLVTDSYKGDLGTVTATDVAPFATATFAYDRTESGVAGTCTKYDNTAKITETDQSASQTVTLCVGKDLTVTKTAAGTFDRAYLWKISKEVDQTAINIAAGGAATFNYTVGVDQTGISDSGWTLAGKITIANPNDWQDILLTGLTDIVGNGGICTVDPTLPLVPKGGSVDVAYSCSYTSAPSSYSGTNTATATWDKDAASTPSGSASDSATFTLTQLGSTNKTVHVTDSYGGDLGTVTATDVAPFATATFTYDRTESGVAGTCTEYDNTATVTETDQTASKTVKVCVGLDLTVTKTAAGTFDRTYKWLIDKSVDQTAINIAAGGTATFNYTVNVTPNGYTDSAWRLGGTITVSNPNDWQAITADVTDAYAGGGTCTVLGGTAVAILAGQSVTLDYSCDFGGQPAYTGKNTATATWDKAKYFTPKDTASGEADATITLKGETNRTITVIDDKTNPQNPATLGTSDYYTGPFEFQYALDQSGVAGTCKDYTNTAVIKETNLSDSQTVTVCVGKDLTVSKTAIPTFTRTWTWEITKDSDGSYNLFAGDTVTHDYKVVVSPTSTDSDWKVVGVITITNPNDWEDITLANLSDAVDNGGSCTVDPGPYVVAKSGLVQAGYTCTWSSMPSSYDGTNTATATWNSTAFATPTGTASGSSGFKFDDKKGGNPTEINPVITVDDDNLTGENWSADRTNAQWTYTKDFACSTDPAAYKDGKYSYSLTNTAKIDETGASDTATVDVTCYWPQIYLAKSGDTLSKIGDGVTYEIDLFNNTPADAGLRALSCTISDPSIGFTKDVILASGASDTSIRAFTIPTNASDPFVNTASVTCKPVAATAPIVGSSTFSVSDSRQWSTNLFQPKVEIIKTGPRYATSGDVITYTFTINNLSSSDSPNLVLDSVIDNVLGDLKAAALAANCDHLVYNGSCTFTATYTVPDVGIQPTTKKNIVTVHYHPAGFPNDVTDWDDHTVTIVPKSQLTDTSYCPLPNDQFRLLYRLYQAPNIYLLNGSNPGQFYFNAFYYGAAGSDFTMTIEVPYPFMTQEGAGRPIQVHDGTGLTSGGCYVPTPALDGFTIGTEAMTPVSSAGNQIITKEDYGTKLLGQSTTVTVTGKVPATGIAYVTIHLDYSLKKTQPWKPAGTFTTNPVTGASIGDMNSAAGFGSGPVTIHGYEVYNFSRTVNGDTSTSKPASYNEIKKFAGFLGFVTDAGFDPVPGATIKIYGPAGTLLKTVITDADGYYMFAYKHTAKSAQYKLVLQSGPGYPLQTKYVTVKANGFAGVDFALLVDLP